MPDMHLQEDVPDPVLQERFDEALAYAVAHHRRQLRKGTDIPYVAHLLQVCGIVLEAGGDEEQAIAALLHDAIEDAEPGEAETVRRHIRSRFGDRVLGMVEACTDADVQPKPPWRARKEQYLAHLASIDDDALLISCADKLHNSSAILRDLRSKGDRLWVRFAGGRDGTLWYYRALADAYLQRTAKLSREIDAVVRAIEREATPVAG